MSTLKTIKPYKVGQQVWKININKPKTNKSYSIYKEGIHIKEMKILGVSKSKVCLDDIFFTSLTNDKVEGHRKDKRYNTYIGDVSVHIRAKDGLFDAGIFATLYTTSKPTRRTLNRIYGRIANQIQEEYSFLMKGAADEIFDMVDNYNFS